MIQAKGKVKRMIGWMISGMVGAAVLLLRYHLKGFPGGARLIPAKPYFPTPSLARQRTF